VRERIPGTLRSTLADYSRRSAHGEMPRDLDPGLPVVWFSEADWEALAVPAGGFEMGNRWMAFRERFPGSGWITFGEVGFSRDGREAVLSVWIGDDALAGAGYVARLEKTADGWTLRERERTVVA
jgi:hypothetical protein